MKDDFDSGTVHLSEEKKPVDPAAEARRKLREQLLQGSSEIVITGNGNVFQENNQLRGRVQTLEPFFSNPATNTTTNYEKAVPSLFEKLNETVSSLDNLISDEDDRLF